MRSAYSKISKMSKSLVPTLLQKLIEFCLIQDPKGSLRWGSSPVCTPLRDSREGEQDTDVPNPHNNKKPGLDNKAKRLINI